MKSPIYLLQAFFADAKRLMPCVRGLDRDLETIKNRFKNEGLSFLTVTLPTICDALDRGLADGRFACPTCFSHKGALPKIFSGLLCEVFDIASGAILEDPSYEAIKLLREITRFFKKAQITSKRNDILHDEACRAFCETDDRLRNQSFDNRYSFIVSQVCKVILPALEYEVSQGILPYRHGPGAVREGVKGNAKWKWLYNHFLNATHQFLPVEFSDFLYNSDREVASTQVDLGVPFGGVAKLISVPKSAIAVRTITVEPLLNQFIQQGLNLTLRDNIRNCKILGQCLALTDQSKNQHLAQVGSITGEWTTIDLSSASDLLSLKLVKLIFQNHPLFLEKAISCRSNAVNVFNKTLAC